MHEIVLLRDKRQKTGSAQEVGLDVHSTRTVFDAWKRGTGMSYTLGRIIEEVHSLGEHLIIVIDPLAVFWSTGIPKPGRSPIPTRKIIPGDPEQVLGTDLVGDIWTRGIEAQSGGKLVRVGLECWSQNTLASRQRSS